MIIGAAQAHGGNTHQHLAGSRRIQDDALDREGSADLTKYGRERVHD
jgi:hypothetical protein